MLTEFQDKVAVITGAGGGIGAALARGFASEGMRVVVADIDEAGARATAQAIGEAAHPFKVDVADESSVQQLADFAFDTLGQVDLLINNAGVFQGGLTWERSRQDWEWIFSVNVYGIIHGIKAFVPRMIAQDTAGHVVNTASVAAYVAGPMSAPYVVSKNTAMSITECLALDLNLVGSKIGASVLTPSNFNTGIAQTAQLRPQALGRDTTDDGVACADALQSMLDVGADPADAFGPVLDGVRNNTFLIATKPSFKEQLKVRYDALLEQALPPMAEVD
jgi:NAD(P)-dependent dehydrogenase (short-subunit alcohol dehydrogenase family)